MLQLLNVRKSYTTADFTQVALDDVSVSFRDNEFVAILGPSGSGKTTLLNIVGGLDHYDSGNLIIDQISTEQYRDRDWDTYRNNRVGFVFQSYNLIPHQSVLSNVELALTLSGVSRAERRERALAALSEVGLADHVHKRPNQLSGGQMQRVAIARALINDPEILLADEPTGALDSQTSVQIMAMLKKIADDRLVVMVTHNPELAEQYATRTVHLSDGRVVEDSDPYTPTEADLRPSQKQAKKTSMSFLTAVALSFNNLMTKKGRTLMTSFAGSIGIIGIAAILALATGVNDYVRSVEEDTLSVYPLTIQSQGMDLTSLLAMSSNMTGNQDEPVTGNNSATGDVHEVQMMTRMFSSVGSNDLASLKKFLESDGGGIDGYVNSIQYSYDVAPQIFSVQPSGDVRQVNPDTTFSALGFGADSSANSLMAASMSTNVFSQMMDDPSLFESQYDVVAGGWPQNPDELVLALTVNGGISDFVLYAMGLRDPAELDAMVQQLVNDEPIVTPDGTKSFSYDDLMAVEFKLVNAADFYAHDTTYDVWTSRRNDAQFVKDLVAGGQTLKISGIVQPRAGAAASMLTPGLHYTSGLTRHLIAQASSAEIVQRQLADPGRNVFSGRTFADEAANPGNSGFDLASAITIDQDKIAAAFTFDESQLSLDLSGLNLDLSGMDLGGLDLGGLGLDLSGITIDASALPSLDLTEIVGGLNLDVDTELALSVTQQAVKGYIEFCVAGDLDPTDVQANFPVFLASEQGQHIAADAAGIIDLDAIGTQLQTLLGDYLQQVMATYLGQITEQFGATLQTQLAGALQTQIAGALESSMSQLATNMSSAMGIDQDAFLDAFQFNMDEEELTQVMMSMMTTGQTSLDTNLRRLGYADLANPFTINIYPKDFESKGRVVEILDDYNAQMTAAGQDEKVITFTDIVGTLMSSVTDIVNVISYVLVAFVAISLVVSSIMIGVITYISVLERRKEIGILRAIGASKRDIRRVFNAETLIVGFVAGLVGIAITFLLTIPANLIVESKYNIANVAQLTGQAAAVLVLISMGLTFLAGLLPSTAASRKDPVEALRSE